MTIAHSGDARVVVYSRPGCHLCEVAEALVAEICADTGDSWTRVDITNDVDLTSRFTEQVPVTFVDGKDLFWWGVRTPGALERLGALLTPR